MLNDKIYISGGLQEDWMASRKFHCFDPENMQLTELPNMHHVHFSHHMITIWEQTTDQDVLCTVDTSECETHYYDATDEQVTLATHINLLCLHDY